MGRDYERMQSDWERAYRQIQDLKKNVKQKLRLATPSSYNREPIRAARSNARANTKDKWSLTLSKAKRSDKGPLEGTVGRYKKGSRSSDNKRCKNCLNLLTRGLSIANCKYH
eukprot:TRINITY_DN1144_c0_g1_i4.p2 TRINITY_DN1144_c0_g1~~TRINITY_DN1144_c0_g1_i4.p2  ORF type:complete len:112 (-),score=30.36 TRINITY_DN1144_c0_g1_i4:57-392(-)